MKNRFTPGFLLGLLLVSPWALAQDYFVGEQALDVRAEMIRSSQLTLSLGALAAPLCAKDLRSWEIAPPLFFVSPESTKYLPAREMGVALRKRFGAADGERVVIADAALAPYVQEGLKAGDAFPAGIDFHPVPVEPQNTYRERRFAAIAANPDQVYSVRRGDQTLRIPLKNRLTCSGALMIRKSNYRYANSESGVGTMSSGGLVIITYPLLKSLSYREQAMVIAHEIAETATGSNRNTVLTAIGGVNIFVGAGHTEIGRLRQGQPELMAISDLVALWLLSQIEIPPEDYLALVTKLDAEKAGLGAPVYATTRPLAQERKDAIANAIAQWQKDKSLPVPKGYTPEAMAELRSWAASTGLVDGIKALIAETPAAK